MGDTDEMFRDPRTPRQQLNENEAMWARKWDTYLAAERRRNNGRLRLRRDRKLKELVRHGIPNSARPEVWASILDLDRLAAAQKGEYARLLELRKGESTQAIQQIKLDLRRTFPESRHFSSDSALGLQNLEKLERVLTAFSRRNADIGYSQGFNFIAAILLTQFQEEETAFWCFALVIEEMLPIGFYDESLSGCQGYQHVLQLVVNKKLHALADHLSGLGISANLYAVEWFICLFSRNFEYNAVLRIWDCFFYEGYKVLFRVGCALLKIHQDGLLKMRDMMDAMQYLQKHVPQSCNIDRTLHVAFHDLGRFKRSNVDRFRLAAVAKVNAELVEFRKRRSKP